MTRTLELLGYAPDERVLVIHEDDIGASHGSNVAALEGMTGGSLTCGSVLVPAPWSMEAARLQREHPEADLGVHMTLTCEYETYRWRSMTGHPSLHAPDGGMWRDAASVVEHVAPDVAKIELRAQIEHALAAGIDVTHIDTHMITMMLPSYLPVYADLAIEFRVPLFFPRMWAERPSSGGDVHAQQGQRLDALGWPLTDHMIVQTLIEVAPEDKERQFRAWFSALRPGLTHFLVHPAAPGAELEAMSPDDWRHRAKDYELFRTREMRAYCESLGVRVTGYREIRERLRANLGGA